MSNRLLLITHNIGENYLKGMETLLPNWTIIAGKEKEVWSPHIKDAEIIVGWKKELEAYVLNKDAKLRWLQSWSAGVNSMPLAKMAEKEILLTSANGVHAYPISETIFALMLSMTRKIHTYVNQQREKKWHHAHMSMELHEKTIGIIGVGAIGQETARIAKAFRMKVLGVRHSGQPAENVDEMFTPNQLDDILPHCDYVVLTLPLTPETKGLFDQKAFQLMKNSAFFINIGRGEVVEEEALIRALQTKEIAGAGLDVFVTEPLEQTHPLWEMENVIITPHTAGSTENYTKRVMEELFFPNLKKYLQHDFELKNIVDYKKGY